MLMGVEREERSQVVKCQLVLVGLQICVVLDCPMEPWNLCIRYLSRYVCTGNIGIPGEPCR